MPAEPPSRYPPADARRRLVARALDLALAVAPLFLAPRAGEWLAIGLLCFGDALFGPGRSLGKRIAGLRVIALATRRPASVRQSMLRNLIFALALVPHETHLRLGALGCIAALEALVALRPLTRDFGQRRLGDLLARTQVIDASIALGITAQRAPEPPRATAPLASRAARQQEPTCASH